jgi:hypothetical protein
VLGVATSNLNAGLFAFTGNPITGQVEDQKASYLGAAMACTAPAAAAPGQLELFGSSWPLGSVVAGISTMDILCSPSPALGQPGALLVDCGGPFGADPSGRVTGGIASSNTIDNPNNAVPGAPTGSIWTTYVFSPPGVSPPPPVGGHPPPTPAPSAGLDFYVFRTSADNVSSTSSNCAGASAGAVVGARSSVLHPVSPNLADGRLPQNLGPAVGTLTVCFTSSGGISRTATAHIDVSAGGTTTQIDACGTCRESSTPASAGVRAQACDLPIDNARTSQPGGISGGLVTSLGLVRADNPLVALNSHIWTLALFVRHT